MYHQQRKGKETEAAVFVKTIYSVGKSGEQGIVMNRGGQTHRGECKPIERYYIVTTPQAIQPAMSMQCSCLTVMRALRSASITGPPSTAFQLQHHQQNRMFNLAVFDTFCRIQGVKFVYVIMPEFAAWLPSMEKQQQEDIAIMQCRRSSSLIQSTQATRGIVSVSSCTKESWS